MVKSARMPPPTIGSVLHETYRLERLLGEGGMGAVYEASHLRLSRRFAVKVLIAPDTEDGTPDQDVVARFRREAELTSKLHHPHIVEIIDFNESQGLPYIVMELLEGESLAERLRRVGRMTPSQAAAIVLPAASALQAAHDRGIIHRDLKPSNIFLSHREGTAGDYIKIVDFGLSKTLTTPSMLTRPDQVLGSPWYMAPEQARSAAEVTARTDVFAMGVIIYEMLVGKPPYPDANIYVVMRRILEEEPPSLTAQGVSADLEAVVMRALRKAPEERYRTMLELSQAYGRVVGADLEAGSAPWQGPSNPWAATLPAQETLSGIGPNAATTPAPSEPAPSPPAPAPVPTTPAPIQATASVKAISPARTRTWVLVVGATLALVIVAAVTWLVLDARRPRAGAPGTTATPDIRAQRAPDAGPVRAAVVVPDARSERATRPDARASKDRRIWRAKKTPAIEISTAPASLTVGAISGGDAVPAEIFLDGKKIGVAPVVNYAVKAGPHSVEARLGHERATKQIKLAPGAKERVALELSSGR
jgi:eukaryotic-like serine/threonine-protein kinase